MKKMLFLILMIFSFSVLVPAKTILITVTGNYFDIADADYADLYGDKQYFPEGKLALRVIGNFYLWGSYGTFSTSYSEDKWSHKAVEEADLEFKSAVGKEIISGGLGYYAGYIKKNEISVKLEIGLCKITNNYKLTDTEIMSGTIKSSEERKESGIGVRGNISGTYGLLKNVFGELSFGYLYAVDKVEDIKINLGGFRVSVGIGFGF